MFNIITIPNKKNKEYRITCEEGKFCIESKTKDSKKLEISYSELQNSGYNTEKEILNSIKNRIVEFFKLKKKYENIIVYYASGKEIRKMKEILAEKPHK